jgi:HK97 family phage major capsid protein
VPYSNVISRSDAQALIPEDVSEAMLGGLQNQAAALSLFTRIPVAQAQTRLPILSALPTAYWVNGETGLKQTTEVNWTNRFLNIEELAAIVPIPEATLEDTSFDVWGSIRPLLENAIARALDAAVFFGTAAPASFPVAVATAAAAAGNTVTRGANAAAAGGIVGDLSDMFATVEADGYMVDGLIANTSYKGRLRQARATTGESLLNLGQVDANSVFGVDVAYPMRGLWPAPGAGAIEAIAMERDQFVIGVRRDFTYKLLDQAVIQDNTGAIIYNLAQQDMVALRVTFRVGWQVANVINYDQSVDANRYPAAVLHQ